MTMPIHNTHRRCLTKLRPPSFTHRLRCSIILYSLQKQHRLPIQTIYLKSFFILIRQRHTRFDIGFRSLAHHHQPNSSDTYWMLFLCLPTCPIRNDAIDNSTHSLVAHSPRSSITVLDSGLWKRARDETHKDHRFNLVCILALPLQCNQTSRRVGNVSDPAFDTRMVGHSI